MKISKFITAGVAAGVSLFPSISNAITAAHITVLSQSYKAPAGETVQAVQNVVNPENMSALQSFLHSHPGVGIAALGAIVALPLVGAMVYAVSLYPSNEYENKKEDSSNPIIDKIKSMRDKVFSNDKSPIHKI